VKFARPWDDYLFPLHKQMAAAARRNVGDLHGRVLDLGCGESPFRRFLPADCEYVGVDMRAQPNAALRAAAEALPFADAVFDGAMCTEMLCLSPRPWQIAGELARVLKPGGALYITAPFSWHIMDCPDYFRFTPQGIQALLEGAGFQVERMEPIGGLFSSTAGELTEAIVADAWLPLTRAVGLKRGGYRAAALMTAPLNAVTRIVTPLLDRVVRRKPTSTAVRARRL